jgi:restriction system protein
MGGLLPPPFIQLWRFQVWRYLREMSIPDYQSCMLPLLRFHADNREHSLSEIISSLSDEFSLTEEEREQLLPSGRQEVFSNRVSWARVYLKKAALLEAPRRGFSQITERGMLALKESPIGINSRFLERFPEFRDFRNSRRSVDDVDTVIQDLSKTADETLESAYQKMRDDLAAELLQRLKECTPAFFERLVLDVLVKMGYGGNRVDASRAVGRTGDGGIDGVIKEDKLGLDTIYVQAKRWENKTVGRPDVQRFVGALTEKRARKGVFITTADYSKEARECVSHIDPKVVLIDGETLAQLMIDHHVGVSTITTYELKRIDSDYFIED